jgi:hypothetical protein
LWGPNGISSESFRLTLLDFCYRDLLPFVTFPMCRDG